MQFGIDDDFFDLGGDSLVAIQIIADLQLKGYRITARLFNDHSTIREMAQVISGEDGAADSAESRWQAPVAARNSPAQGWFHRQQFFSPNHWNQLLVLESDTIIDRCTMEQTVQVLTECHPLLRTRFPASSHDGPPVAVPVGQVEPFSYSDHRGMDISCLDSLVARLSEQIQETIDLQSGRVFRLHLARVDDCRHILILAAHHLCIDAVSWRIVIDDIVRDYAARIRGESSTFSNRSFTFWHWTNHLYEHAVQLTADIPMSADSLQRGGHDSEDEPAFGKEENASTLWVKMSSNGVPAATSRFCDALQAHLSTVLLGAFAYAYAKVKAVDTVSIAVESHGRECLDPDGDVSRVVGWFTSIFPLALEVDRNDVFETMRSVSTAMGGIRHLGLGYELLNDTGREIPRNEPRLCFNFLGDFRIRQDAVLPLKISSLTPAPARGMANHRPYDLVFTVKMMNGALVAELCYSGEYFRRHELQSVAAGMRAVLHGKSSDRLDASDWVVSEMATGGLLTYVPRSLSASGGFAEQNKAYRTVLLTGATGFVGVHVLEELLRQSGAHIYCLLRYNGELAPQERLAKAFQYHVPELSWESVQSRITAIAGDVSLPQFGLAESRYLELVQCVDAVYHFAADVRLFGESEHFERHNVDGVRNIIAFATAGRTLDIHYMSTLAVAGFVANERRVRFDEDCLDIRQQFQNHYERSKYQAEVLLRNHAASEGRVYIYRSGNVTAHSGTAVFQRNAEDNQFIQVLRGLIASGTFPARTQEHIVLSPVDVVARGIVRISLSPVTTPGTFHVDNGQATPYPEIFNALVRLGIRLQPVETMTLVDSLASGPATRGVEQSLGLFWASRPRRNVIYSNERTLSLLRNLGVEFPEIDGNWLERFLSHLMQHSALRAAGNSACLVEQMDETA